MHLVGTAVMSLSMYIHVVGYLHGTWILLAVLSSPVHRAYLYHHITLQNVLPHPLLYQKGWKICSTSSRMSQPQLHRILMSYFRWWQHMSCICVLPSVIVTLEYDSTCGVCGTRVRHSFSAVCSSCAPCWWWKPIVYNHWNWWSIILVLSHSQIGEYGNYASHIALRDLRPPGVFNIHAQLY